MSYMRAQVPSGAELKFDGKYWTNLGPAMGVGNTISLNINGPTTITGITTPGSGVTWVPILFKDADMAVVKRNPIFDSRVKKCTCGCASVGGRCSDWCDLVRTDA